MTIYDAVATALQRDTEAARVFMIRLEELGYTICKRDDPAEPNDALSLLPPAQPDLRPDHEIGEGPTR